MSSIRMSSLAGLPVILNGRACACVEQPVLERDGRRLRGLVVRRGFGGAKWVSRENIQVAGGVSVIVSDKPGKVPDDADFALQSVRDTLGLTLGRVSDAWLDDATLRVEAIEILPGLVETILSGPLKCGSFAVCPTPDEPGRVTIPDGLWLEKSRSRPS